MSNPEHGPHASMSSRSRQMLQRVGMHVRPGSFELLLAATLFLYVLNGLAVDSPLGAALVMLGRVAVLAAGVYVLSANRVTLYLGLFMVGCIILFESHAVPMNPATGVVVRDALTVGLLLWVLVIVLREIFRRSTSERDAVVGALCGFLLLITVFMRVHALLEGMSPGAYLATGPALAERPEAEVIAAFQYFSTVTLTTVGFGDIVPVSPDARLATGLEAIVGQLYLAVVVATLVGRVAARRE
jgi:voltage-gated potassium channel Kch